jgi:hypothetical protein
MLSPRDPPSPQRGGYGGQGYRSSENRGASRQVLLTPRRWPRVVAICRCPHASARGVKLIRLWEGVLAAMITRLPDQLGPPVRHKRVAL